MPSKFDGTRLCELWGYTFVAERHGARSLMGMNYIERLVASAIWSRENPLFPAHCQHGVDLPFISYKCGIILI